MLPSMARSDVCPSSILCYKSPLESMIFCSGNEYARKVKQSCLCRTFKCPHSQLSFQLSMLRFYTANFTCKSAVLLVTVIIFSHQTVSRLLSKPNIQSGKYNEMDSILIGTAVSERVIKEMSKPAIPLVKAL